MINTHATPGQPEEGTEPLCRLLVVDDEKDFVQTLIKRLHRRGVACEGVFTGEEAVETIKERKFDIVLLDMKLPGMDGNNTLIEIRKLQADTQVIILTGHASANEGLEGMKNGAIDYLMKPVEFESLYEKLMNAVKKING